MAETLTYSESEPTGSEGVTLNESEQEALQVGEQLEKEQGNAKLAGKFESPEQLEKAYMELQSKLGSREEESDEEESYEEDEETERVDYSDFLDELYEQAQGEPSDEFVEQLQGMEPAELADMYVNYRQQVEANQNQTADFSEEQVDALYNMVGGKDQYATLMNWAVENVSEQEVEMFDAVMDSGDANAAFWAIRGLAMQYADTNGYDGKRISGKAPRNDGRQFKSQAELVQAMADPRYDSDEAYRADVMSKLSESNLNF